MIATIPLDKNNVQIRIDDIIELIKNGRPELGIVFKMTGEFVWTKCPLYGDINKRHYRNVEIKNNVWWNKPALPLNDFVF